MAFTTLPLLASNRYVTKTECVLHINAPTNFVKDGKVLSFNAAVTINSTTVLFVFIPVKLWYNESTNM